MTLFTPVQCLVFGCDEQGSSQEKIKGWGEELTCWGHAPPPPPQENFVILMLRDHFWCILTSKGINPTLPVVSRGRAFGLLGRRLAPLLTHYLKSLNLHMPLAHLLPQLEPGWLLTAKKEKKVAALTASNQTCVGYTCTIIMTVQ